MFFSRIFVLFPVIPSPIITKKRICIKSIFFLFERREAQLPLKTVIHGELWEKNVLLHLRSSREMSSGKSPLTKRKNFDARSSNGSSINFQLDDDVEEEDLADPNNLPYDVMLSDWKYASIGSPTVDLASLILSSTPSQAFREKFTEPLLQRYYDVFTDTLKTRFSIDVAAKFPSFSYEELQKDYETSLYGSFLKVILFIQILLLVVLSRLLTSTSCSP